MKFFIELTLLTLFFSSCSGGLGSAGGGTVPGPSTRSRTSTNNSVQPPQITTLNKVEPADITLWNEISSAEHELAQMGVEFSAISQTDIPAAYQYKVNERKLGGHSNDQRGKKLGHLITLGSKWLAQYESVHSQKIRPAHIIQLKNKLCFAFASKMLIGDETDFPTGLNFCNQNITNRNSSTSENL